MKNLLLLLLFLTALNAYADQRLGYIDSGGNFWIKEGSLYANWVEESGNGNVAQIAYTYSRIGVLDTSGNLVMKEPGLYDNWVLETGNVAQMALTETRIGVLLTNGSFVVKEGTLYDGWTTIFSSGVQQIAMSGPRIGVLMTNGSFCVIEGDLTAACTPVANGVHKIALAHQWNTDRIGYLDSSGNFYVNEGPLNSIFTLEFNNVAQIALTDTRIGMLGNDGTFQVKDGALSAAWTVEAPPSAGVAQIVLSGTRIGYRQNNGSFYAKDGALNAVWVLESGGATSIAFSDYSLVNVTGSEQVVYYSNSCPTLYDTDYPDTPTRAFRDVHGLTQLIIGNNTLNHRMLGSSLTSPLTVDCNQLLQSGQMENPNLHDDQEWLHGAMYTPDGTNVAALVHNEYHGWEFPSNPLCPSSVSNPSSTCWKTATTLAISSNAGASYALAGTPPYQSIAWSPYPYDDTANDPGLSAPSNIVLNPNDGYYYATVWAWNSDYLSQTHGMCVIRTSSLFNPTSWRAYDGTGFNTAFYDSLGNPVGNTCYSVGLTQIPNGMMPTQLTFNTYLNQFMLIGDYKGVYFLVSNDLIHWSNPTRLVGLNWPAGFPTTAGACSGTACPKAYAVVFDPNDSSRNYERPGQTVNLYYTRFNNFVGAAGQVSPDGNRDLVDLQIQFQQ